MKIKRSCLLWIVVLLAAGPAGAQWDDQRTEIYKVFTDRMPQEYFVRNMQEHRVKTVTRKNSVAERKWADASMGFYENGLMAVSEVGYYKGKQFFYGSDGKLQRVLTSTRGSDDRMWYWEELFDKEGVNLVTRNRLDSTGKVVAMDHTMLRKKVKDTISVVMRTSAGKEWVSRREFIFGDTTYMELNCGMANSLQSEKGCELWYTIFRKGRVIQEGEMDERPYRDDTVFCYGPPTPAFVKKYAADKERRAMLALLKEHPEYMDEIGKLLKEGKKPKDNEAALVPRCCYRYDDKGRLVEMGGKDFRHVRFEYDVKGRLLRSGEGDYYTTYHYNDKGLLTGWSEDQTKNEVSLEYTFY